MLSGKNRTIYLIKKAIIKLLKEKKLSQITVMDICETAMIGRSTFYNHYHDKYEILEEMNNEFVEILDQVLKKRFLLADVEEVLKELMLKFDRESFLTLIEIQEESVHLEKDLKAVLGVNFLDYYYSSELSRNWQIESDFAKDLFCAVSLTFIQNTIKTGEVERNTKFINEQQRKIFR